MPKIRKLPVPELDPRTAQMSAHVLRCRSRPGGHLPTLRPNSSAELLDLAAQGLRQEVYVCSGGCGYTRTLIYRRATGEVVSDTGGRYTDRDYLVPPGSGRMQVTEARKALWLREDAQLYRG